MTKEQIKEAIKEMGYNTRQVSVKENRCGYSRSYTLTIRDASVDFNAINKLAFRAQEIDRCPHTHEILAGGNTFVDVSVLGEVEREWAAPYYNDVAGLVELAIEEAEENGPHSGPSIFIDDYNVCLMVDDTRSNITLYVGNQQHLTFWKCEDVITNITLAVMRKITKLKGEGEMTCVEREKIIDRRMWAYDFVQIAAPVAAITDEMEFDQPTDRITLTGKIVPIKIEVGVSEQIEEIIDEAYAEVFDKPQMSQDEIRTDIRLTESELNVLTASMNVIEQENSELNSRINKYKSAPDDAGRYILPTLEAQQEALLAEWDKLKVQRDKMKARLFELKHLLHTNAQYQEQYMEQGPSEFMASLPFYWANIAHTAQYEYGSFEDFIFTIDWVALEMPMKFADYNDNDWLALNDHLIEILQPA